MSINPLRHTKKRPAYGQGDENGKCKKSDIGYFYIQRNRPVLLSTVYFAGILCYNEFVRDLVNTP